MAGNTQAQTETEAKPSAGDELTEGNIENAVVYVSNGFSGGYEWVFGLSGSLIDGRKLVPHTENGELSEMVSGLGNYYSNSVRSLLRDEPELLGYAETREQAAELARNHYEG